MSGLILYSLVNFLIIQAVVNADEPSVNGFCNGLSDDAEEAFAAGDRAVQQDGSEQNARSFLSKSEGNEFLSTQQTLEFALLPGNSIRRASCVYTPANRKPCTASPFREYTGRCNNLQTKTWGMAGTPYTRVLDPRYEDENSGYRVTEFHSGNPMKSARNISATVTQTPAVLNEDGPNSHIMQWGQFIAHEFTAIGEIRENISCCPDDICPGGNLSDAQISHIMAAVKRERANICIPIENYDDPIFGHYVCMHQVRSKIAPEHTCSSGPWQQMNLNSHVFDGSAVYGSSRADANSLRTFVGGLMKTQTVNDAILPPCASATSSHCPFTAGDNRVNTTPNLSAYHAIFLVLHNKIANQLKALNSGWKDERLYQETRRIVAAIEASIHYYEWLPIVLGPDMMTKYSLSSYDGYDSTVNPSILNELAGAAFRFGHSTINGVISLIHDDFVEERGNLTIMFHNTTQVHTFGVRQCLRGLTKDKPWIVDKNFPRAIRNQLFNKRNDLVSLNINRGRDHGFASYLDYRRFYGLSIPYNWEELHDTHPPDVVQALQSVYTDVEDLELYIAGVTEKHMPGSLIGETFGNIIADGFSKNRKGDRQFFESSQSGLSEAQIAAIRSYTLSQLLCDGSDIEAVPSQGFSRTEINGVVSVPCSELPKLDLSAWAV